MFAPVRQPLSYRPGFSSGLIASAAVVSVMFAATAFLLPEFSREFGISTQSTGWYSSIQVASFALASFGAGRFLRTSRGLLVGATTAFAIANFLSVIAPGFGELLAMRVIAGLSAGTVNWIAWSEAARRPAAMGKVAVIGPIAAAAGSLAFAPLLGTFGYRSVFLLLAGLGLVALAFPAEIAKGERVGRQVSDSRSNLVVLVAAAALTLFGSAGFIYVGVKLAELDAPTWVLSIAMTGNAVAGIAGTRFVARRAWPWLLAIAVSVAAAVAVPVVWVTVAGLWAWGFTFWLAVPRMLRLLEERSDRPGERTGDAQGLMAIGRIAGPAVGGGLEAIGGFVLLGVVASAGIAGAAVATAGVERFRADDQAST